MRALAMTAPTSVDRDIEQRPIRVHYANVAFRYGLSSFGPIAISGAHFLASIVFLRVFSRTDFGLLSFLFTIVPFCLSACGALIGVSVARIARATGLCDADLATHLKVNLLFSTAAGVCVFVLLLLGHGGVGTALLLGFYAALMTLRWFGRTVAYTLRAAVRVALSDFVYAVGLIAGLGVLYALHALNATRAAEALVLAAASGLVALGKDHLKRLLWPGKDGSLAAFGTIWRELARWSVLGVALTELTANAHVYLVTFAFGPASFALLAIGALLMRPVLLVLSALPDLERPEMARRIAAGDTSAALRSVKEFRTAAGAVWLATVFLAGAILMWSPHLILRHGYDVKQVLIVLALWGAITAVRVARTPESVLLQAAGEFRSLAGAGAWSSLASLAVTVWLALSFGPIASLGGILIGDLVMTGRIFTLSGRWKRCHG